ncbi:hypothetical protein DWF00_01340 [Bosea caraganae]|uniref:Uncharacterized protein n=1 Tax=Bosea caraganae TaxID=2763117 RepID=A0A370L8Y2_9HYPH|nr:hypothetical protein [Bosea caraganae]RDJ26851.1 hypothetical protein DWE98_08360 [Bosea caraganae]RDJ30737.1 hypothetical protein DWF00_01340 [Bosea caraganae]
MLGGLGAFIASEVGGAVRRNVTIYSLYGLAGLLLFGALGFALGALHTALAAHYGSVSASLIIAGALLVLALIAFGVAAYLKGRPRPSRPLATAALVGAPIAAKMMGSRMAWRMGLAGAVVALGAVLGRQIFKATGGSGEDEEA